MAELKHVFDGTCENFPQLVLDNSRKGLVVVNYWTTGAGPCMRLWQTLEKLSQDYAGRLSTPTLKVLPSGIRAQENIGNMHVHAKMLTLAEQSATPEKLDARIETSAEDTAAMLSCRARPCW